MAVLTSYKPTDPTVDGFIFVKRLLSTLVKFTFLHNFLRSIAITILVGTGHYADIIQVY